MSLQIFLLGQFKLQTNNQSFELSSRPAQSLLAYLALNAGVTCRREKLASLLWPEATEANARRYLRQALWRIRKSLASGSLVWEDYLHISDISVTFDDQSDYLLDADDFLEPTRGQSVAEIIKTIHLYRGELLPGFYDEWIVLERDRFQSAYQQKMNLLLERLNQAGRWDDVLRWGEEWIRLGYSPEPAYRALMHAYVGLGDQSMVSVTYQRCVEALNRELGIKPSLETQRLYEQICHGELNEFESYPSLWTDLADQQPYFLNEVESHQVESPIFVARECQLARLDSFLNLALAGQGRVVFVTGEAGSGKTALVHEFTRRAQNAHPDLIVASGHCNAHTGIGDPYLPFREILEMLTGDIEAQWAAGTITREHAQRLWHTLPLVAQALVEVGQNLIDTFVSGHPLLERIAAAVPGGAGWRSRLAELVEHKVADSIFPNPQQSDLFEQFTRVLQTLAGKVSTVLVIDDLQWADLGSISLLFHLGLHLTGRRILIVGAYRPEEVAIGRDGERHPLNPVINEFQRTFGDITVSLGQEEGRDFVEALLNKEPNRLANPFREMLYRQTHGHPLFTIELLRGMQERGDLLQDQDGRWVEGSTLDWVTLPPKVEAVIAERITRLSRPLRAALRVASVEGETFTAEVVAQVRATDEREMLERLSGELYRRHRLIRVQSIQRVNGQLLSRYQFRHILFQKYLYSSLDEVERVYLHEQVGAALEGLYETQGKVAAIAPQLARHFQEAKVTEKAIHYLHQAGDRAVQMSAYQEGIAHLTQGLSLLMTLPDSLERSHKELALQLSLGKAWMGDIPGPEWEKAIIKARELCQQMGKATQLCRVLGGMSILHYVRAEYMKARELAEESLCLAQQARDPLHVVLGHWYLGFILFALGEYTAARAHLQKVISFYEPQQHHQPFVHLRGSDIGPSALAYDACCLWSLGYPEQALKRSQESIALAQDLNHAFSTADAICFAGCMFNAMRRDALALKENAEELMRLSKTIGFLTWLGVGTCYRGESLAKMGQIQEGMAQIHKGLTTRQSNGSRCYLTGLLGALAEAQAKAGLVEEGLSTLTEAFSFVRQSDERHWEAELYRLQGELLLAQGNETEAEGSFSQAIEIACHQQAKSWELRATISLARLWQKQGLIDEARHTLVKIYDWFREGFDTPDLREARELLVDMHPTASNKAK